MTCCPCGLIAHGLQVWGNRDCASFHLRYSGPCSRCLCGHGPAYGCIKPGTVVQVTENVARRVNAELLPPSWIRAIFKWTSDGNDGWITEGGSIYSQFGGLHLSPMDTAIVSSILERIVPNES